MRRLLITLLMLAEAETLVAAETGRTAPSAGQPFSVVEATISDMQVAMEQRRITSREIVLHTSRESRSTRTN